jgi:putative heme-binding domain-containing protein
VTYTGTEDTSQPPAGFVANQAASTRLGLEKLHTKLDREAVDAAWKELSNADRFTRFAARVALEHQDPKLWTEKALAETDAAKVIPAILALARVSAPCPQHTADKKVHGDPALRGKMLEALGRIDFTKLTDEQKTDLARTYQIVLNRFGSPTTDERKAWLDKYASAFPTGSRFVDAELLQVLVYLQDEATAAKAVKLLKEAPTQEEQLEYARALRMLKAGWTPELRKDYFTWFIKAANYKGGSSFANFLKLIKTDAIATLTPAENVALKEIINANPATVKLPDEAPRPFVKAYKVADLTDALEKGLKAGRDFERGRKLFGTGKCFACHRFDNEGGSNGPDLTGVAGRFSARDLLESILDPSKEVSDQYGAIEIRTTDERIVIGRIVNLSEDRVMVNTDMMNPGSTVAVDRKTIEVMKPSKISMMPAGLMDTFKEDEVLDLMAYLLSRGDRNHAMFKK